jgi:predicted RNA-binding Zn ribbon-like protein
MPVTTPENRSVAPGRLRVVQEFMNSAHLGGRVFLAPEVAEAIRSRRQLGESQGTLAADYGLSQKFVAAVGRGARLDDELGTAESAASWLVERQLLPAEASLSDAELDTLRELRELLRALATANNGHELAAEVTLALNRIGARSPLAVQFDAGNAALAPLVRGIDGAIAALLATVYEAMRDGTFQRLKRCPGDGCPHTFYDSSRNRTGTWCSMSVCGNRTKVRSYQSRRRAAKSTY